MAKFVPLDSRRKSEEIADQIRELAISRRLRSGERLPPERLLAEQFNVSRLGVREALRLLELQGFLIIKRGRHGGAYVQDMHSRPVVSAFDHMLRLGHISIQQLLDARLAIEVSLLPFISVKNRNEWLAQLEANVVEAEDLRLAAQRQPARRIDLLQNLHQFHHLLADATNNPVFVLSIEAIIASISHHLDESGHEGCVSLESVSEHRAILNALKSRRLDEARAALEAHLKADSRRMSSVLVGRYRPQQARGNSARPPVPSGRPSR